MSIRLLRCSPSSQTLPDLQLQICLIFTIPRRAASGWRSHSSHRERSDRIASVSPDVVHCDSKAPFTAPRPPSQPGRHPYSDSIIVKHNPSRHGQLTTLIFFYYFFLLESRFDHASVCVDVCGIGTLGSSGQTVGVFKRNLVEMVLVSVVLHVLKPG